MFGYFHTYNILSQMKEVFGARRDIYIKADNW